VTGSLIPEQDARFERQHRSGRGSEQ
jgi:hypothetical protein